MNIYQVQISSKDFHVDYYNTYCFSTFPTTKDFLMALEDDFLFLKVFSNRGDFFPTEEKFDSVIGSTNNSMVLYFPYNGYRFSLLIIKSILHNCKVNRITSCLN